VRKILFAFVALALVTAGCSKSSTSKPSITVGNVPSTIQGNVLTIPVTVKGITIVKPNGDTSGKTGHFHIFIDKLPVKPGVVIPHAHNIVHTADDPIKIYGLTPGMHKLHIVIGDGAHIRIAPSARAVVKVKVDGPSVQGLAPATILKGQALTVELRAEGVKIVAPGTETGTDEGHFHVLVDPATPPKAGESVDNMTSAPEASPMSSPEVSPMASAMTFMTGGTSQTITGLTPGEHVIWVVLAGKDHKAWNPPVMDRLTVTVG
jgi:hypothetical protein